MLRSLSGALTLDSDDAVDRGAGGRSSGLAIGVVDDVATGGLRGGAATTTGRAALTVGGSAGAGAGAGSETSRWISLRLAGGPASVGGRVAPAGATGCIPDAM